MPGKGKQKLEQEKISKLLNQIKQLKEKSGQIGIPPMIIYQKAMY